MKQTFPTQLKELRKKAQLTNLQLAQLASVPTSLVAGLQTGKRAIGEHQARKLGTALKLEEKALEQFVSAIRVRRIILKPPI